MPTTKVMVFPRNDVGIEGGNTPSRRSSFETSTSRISMTQKDVFNIRDTDTYKRFKPLLISMKICGLFSDVDFTIEDDSLRQSRFHCRPGSWLLSLTVILLFLGNLVRLGFSIVGDKHSLKFGSLFMMQVQLGIFYTECLLKLVVLLHTCHSPHLLPRLFQLLDTYFRNRKRSVATLGRLRRMHNRLFAFAIVNILGQFGVSAFIYTAPSSMGFTSEIVTALYYPMTPQDVSALAYTFRIGLAGVHLLYATSSVFPVVFYVLLSFGLIFEMDRVNTRLHWMIEDERVNLEDRAVGLPDYIRILGKKQPSQADLQKSSLVEEFEALRQTYELIIHGVRIADQCFHLLIGVALCANIILVCSLLYGLLFTTASKLVACFWLVVTCFQMFCFAYIGVKINSGAHAPLDDIFKLKASMVNADKLMQFHLFLNRLTGTTISYSALTMFPITKSSILTIFGLIGTYFAVVIQFQATPSSFTCNCGNNETTNAVIGK